MRDVYNPLNYWNVANLCNLAAAMNSEYNFYAPGVFVPKIINNIIKRATLGQQSIHHFHK